MEDIRILEQIDIVYRKYETSKISDYPDAALQVDRFRAIIDSIDLNNKKILHVGCGYGCFTEFLKDNNIKYKSYTGVDNRIDSINNKKDRDVRLIEKSFQNIDELKSFISPIDYDVAVMCCFFHMFSVGAVAILVPQILEFVNESIISIWGGNPWPEIESFVNREKIPHSVESVLEKCKNNLSYSIEVVERNFPHDSSDKQVRKVLIFNKTKKIKSKEKQIKQKEKLIIQKDKSKEDQIEEIVMSILEVYNPDDLDKARKCAIKIFENK